MTITNDRMAQMASAATACRIITPCRSLSRLKFTIPSTRMTSGVITITAKNKTNNIWPRMSVNCPGNVFRSPLTTNEAHRARGRNTFRIVDVVTRFFLQYHATDEVDDFRSRRAVSNDVSFEGSEATLFLQSSQRSSRSRRGCPELDCLVHASTRQGFAVW